MEREIKKLYRDCVELRDYDVQDAIDRREKFRVRHDGNVMTLTPFDLKEKLISISKTFKSKLGKKDYKLCAYEWKPDEVTL